jgi:hypothetical protein
VMTRWPSCVESCDGCGMSVLMNPEAVLGDDVA